MSFKAQVKKEEEEEEKEEDQVQEDYMSDAFLTQVSQKDVRPGLVFKREAQRLNDLEKKKLVTNAKPKKQMEKNRRDEGLQTPLDESNIGFKLLQKMGFNPNVAGIKEPISVTFKPDRSGIGTESAARDKIKSMKRAAEDNAHEYVRRVKSKLLSANVAKDLITSQTACYQLETESGIKEPQIKWFWHFEEKEEIEGDSDLDVEEEQELQEDQEEDKEAMLSTLTEHLRFNFWYCIWCGVRYESLEDMEASCPGGDRDSHDD